MSSTTETSQEFFAGWNLYRQIIDSNLMKHREITQAIKTWSEECKQQAIRILDLGCGDSYLARSSFGELHHVDYTGIDLSAQALKLASQLSPKHWQTDLREGDINTTLIDCQPSFDLILAGYSLHHLSEDQKSSAMKQVKRLLSPTGSFIIYDLMPEEEESASDFLSRFLTHTDSHWQQLSSEQRLSIREHVENYDFPINLTQWKNHATAAGLSFSKILYRDENTHYAIIEFKLKN